MAKIDIFKMTLFIYISGQNKPQYQQRSPQSRSQPSQSQGNFDPPRRHNQNLPDFGDRYSANRTKDRQRREQQRIQQQNQQQNGQQQNQQQQVQQHKHGYPQHSVGIFQKFSATQILLEITY